MLLNGGEFGGVRLLKPGTVELMRTNVLEPGVQVDLHGPKEDGIGFGLDAPEAPDHPLRCLLKKATVRSQASLAAAASYRGVVSLLNPCCVPGYKWRS